MNRTIKYFLEYILCIGLISVLLIYNELKVNGHFKSNPFVFQYERNKEKRNAIERETEL